MPTIPSSFKEAHLRGVFPVEDRGVYMGASFDMGPDRLEIYFTVQDARVLAAALKTYLDFHDLHLKAHPEIEMRRLGELVLQAVHRAPAPGGSPSPSQ